MRSPNSLLTNSALNAAAQQAKQALQQSEPNQWAQDRQIHLWSKQREVLHALQVYKRVAVRSCHDSGKSYVAGVAAVHHIATNRPGTARVVTTAPTSMQVKGILWVEINSHFGNNNQHLQNPDGTPLTLPALPGRTNQTEWWIGTYLAGVGRKPSDYNPAGMQGLHAEKMLIIVDEAAGVTQHIVDAVETLATNSEAKVLMIGNPDDPQSAFANIHGDPEKYGYHIIKIAAADTPNFTGEHLHLPKQVTASLLSPIWVQQRKKAWGVSHPFYIAKVLAEFPSDSENQIALLHQVVAARVPFGERETAGPTPLPATPRKNVVCLGLDVAGSEHGDETILREVTQTQRGVLVGREWRTRTTSPNAIAELAVVAQALTKATTVAVDTVGIGWGVRELIENAFKENKTNAVTMAVNASAAANNKQAFVNKRAELWWAVGRDMFRENKIDTSGAENLEELEVQLLSARYKIVKSKIQVELKDDIRKRLGRSPDNADAMLLAFAPLLERHTLTIVQTPATQVTERHSWGTQSVRMGQLKLVKQRA